MDERLLEMLLDRLQEWAKNRTGGFKALGVCKSHVAHVAFIHLFYNYTTVLFFHLRAHLSSMAAKPSRDTHSGPFLWPDPCLPYPPAFLLSDLSFTQLVLRVCREQGRVRLGTGNNLEESRSLPSRKFPSGIGG